MDKHDGRTARRMGTRILLQVLSFIFAVCLWLAVTGGKVPGALG